MIKIFQGGRGGDNVKTPLLPANNFSFCPPSVLRCFWKDLLMTPHHRVFRIKLGTSFRWEIKVIIVDKKEHEKGE